MPYRHIDVRDLPQWSPWPARLLGVEEWRRPTRTVEKIDTEYDKDKYASYLDFFRTHREEATPERVRERELVHEPSSEVVASLGDDIIVGTWSETCARYDQLLNKTMRDAIAQAGCAVELGSGWGYHLWELSRTIDAQFYGYDYSPNAITLAEEIFASEPRIHVARFDYYANEYDSIFRALARAGFGRVVVYTSHSIEQLPSAANVIKVLSRYADQIATVFHFEPAYDLHRDDLLGLMRRAYAIANDYNRDLVAQLRSRRDIRILRAEADVLGRVPFNPTSVIQWEFARG